VRLSPRTLSQMDSPIGRAYALLDGHREQRPLLDLAQAAPRYPRRRVVVEHLASVTRHPRGAEDTEIAGLPQLREAFAAELGQAYRGDVARSMSPSPPAATRHSAS
jgi:aspartate/methionine/tyrosine aminotransferase